MSARTVGELRALARAGDRGLAHLATQQNTGTWISRCGRQIRGKDIRSWDGAAAGAQAEALGDHFCAECSADAIAVAGDVASGVLVLLSLDPTDASTPQLLEVPVDAIRTSVGLRDPGEDLVASVRQNGVMQPLDARRTHAGLELVAGGRRLAAARAVGLDTVPVIVRDLDDEHATIAMLLANLHREDLDPIAQATAYRDAAAQLELTIADLAKGIGISRSQVSNTIRLLGLPEHLREHVAASRISAQQGRALLACSNEEEQDALADQFLAALAARAGRSRRERTPLDEQLAGIAELLTGVLDAQVRIRAKGDDTEIVIVVGAAERPRVLTRLGLAA